MPQLVGGEYKNAQGETDRREIPVGRKAENRPGHRPLTSYNLPKWVYHPDRATQRIYIHQKDYFGMAADGLRNYENWNIAHVAAFHDDMKMLSLATFEQLREPNKWGLTPAHMCGFPHHNYGGSLCILYELGQMGAVDVEATTCAGDTPWHCAQRNQTLDHLKMFEKVLLKGYKPDFYEERKSAQLRPRGKFAKALQMPVEFEKQAESMITSLSEIVPAKATDVIAPAVPSALPVCLLFPGQGSQYVGMLKELSNLAAVKQMLSSAKEILGYDLLDLCLNGPEEKLAETQFCQPAMYVAGLAAVEKLRVDKPDQVERCKAVAGLSLGEYAALTVAGVFSFEDGLRLVKIRAEAMEHETTKPGAPKQAMLSVAGIDRPKLEECIRKVKKPNEVCQVANVLFPKGFSVAGHDASVQALATEVMEHGALQAKILKTSGAFHTDLMRPAREKLMSALADLLPKMSPPRCQVYMNVTAKPIGPDASPKDIMNMLGDQLVSSVLWEDAMKKAIADGATDFVECGPNKQLTAMMKRIAPKVHSSMKNIAA